MRDNEGKILAKRQRREQEREKEKKRDKETINNKQEKDF